MPIFCVKSVKIYTSQKKITRTPSARPWQIWGMLDHCEIATHWRAFQIEDKSRHGLVKLTYSEENSWCPSQEWNGFVSKMIPRIFKTVQVSMKWSIPTSQIQVLNYIFKYLQILLNIAKYFEITANFFSVRCFLQHSLIIWVNNILAAEQGFHPKYEDTFFLYLYAHLRTFLGHFFGVFFGFMFLFSFGCKNPPFSWPDFCDY